MRPPSEHFQEVLRFAPAALSSAIVHLVLLIAMGLLFVTYNVTDSIEIVVSNDDGLLEVELMTDSLEIEPMDVDAASMADLTFVEEEIVITDVGELATLSLLDGQDGIGATAGAQGMGLSEGLTGEFGEKIRDAQKNGIDIAIVFDSTGSMSSEIAIVKQRISTIGKALLRKIPRARFSLVTYRDHRDTYMVRGIELTDDMSQIDEFLAQVSAAGGGDTPEAVDAGMYWAITKNYFRHNSQKAMLIFGDAPPHRKRLPSCLTMAKSFRRRDKGRVSTITCQHPTPLPEFYEIARAGGGDAYTLQDSRWLMEELLVLAFGQEHRKDVLEFFELGGSNASRELQGVGDFGPDLNDPFGPSKRGRGIYR